MPCLRPARQQPNRQRISPRRQPATNHSLLLRKCVGNLKRTPRHNWPRAPPARDPHSTAGKGCGATAHHSRAMLPDCGCTWPSSSRHAAAAPGPPAPASCCHCIAGHAQRSRRRRSSGRWPRSRPDRPPAHASAAQDAHPAPGVAASSPTPARERRGGVWPGIERSLRATHPADGGPPAGRPPHTSTSSSLSASPSSPAAATAIRSA